MNVKHGRHTPAFLLLFLAEEDQYGGQLLQKCKSEIPVCMIDSAILYRTLAKLESEGAVRTYWKDDSAGKPVKMYHLTDSGHIELAAFKEDIENRLANLTFFVNKYRTL
ncbi:MAG: hypothetical protein PWQ12_1382 [Clostridiales bacterium]|jgi:DNA-binding PadR family transcriptional regulator|nr:hypothetical protein [Clostridiales bacterium]